jgi:hypothetical protein
MIQFFQQFRGHRKLPELGGGRTMGVIDGNKLASAFFKEEQLTKIKSKIISSS